MNLHELGLRLLLLILSILILFFISNRRKSETLNPLFMIIGLCTFSLLYVFTKVEIGVGIGFGLFAIFSILRFRTKAFTINAVIFLFVCMTLSILDVFFPADKYFDLLLFHGGIIIAYFLGTFRNVKYLSSFELTLDTCDFPNLDESKMRKCIAERIPFEEFKYKIISVNAVANEVKVEVFY
ncbi:DUF4956 domain-containing protein [Flavobacterium sp. 3HN19-14]|uniref:DUF4956 domain-containing protein n=1 Tax=Flavobacterium sp. 3HN19-14 TaxID=3448133 RepID=UPI003EE0B9C9